VCHAKIHFEDLKTPTLQPLFWDHFFWKKIPIDFDDILSAHIYLGHGDFPACHV
jgi:hypothetical protein